MRTWTIWMPFDFPNILAFPKLSHCIPKLSPPSFLPVVDAVGTLLTFSWVAQFEATLAWLSMTSFCISSLHASLGYKCPL